MNLQNIPKGYKCFITSINSCFNVLNDLKHQNGNVTCLYEFPMHQNNLNSIQSENELANILDIAKPDVFNRKLHIYETITKSKNVLLIYDAFRGLDCVTRIRLLQYLKKTELTIVYFSNYVEEVSNEKWCDLVCIAYKKKIFHYYPRYVLSKYPSISEFVYWKLSQCKLYDKECAKGFA
tara:strand:- start:575 stop:1111 length:537 start_codon:yes stop_codon:yes gene_type:complete